MYCGTLQTGILESSTLYLSLHKRNQKVKGKKKKKNTNLSFHGNEKGLIQGFFTKVNDVHGPPEFIWNILFELPIFPLAFIETLRAL